MIKRLLVLLAMTAGLVVGVGARTAPVRQGAAAVPAASTPLAEAATLVSKVLPNGLEIIVFEDHSEPIVTIDLAVRNGSFTEPPELNGLSHLYEHMFFTPNLVTEREAAAGTDTSEPGIAFNGSTREEVVEYYYTTTTPNFETAAKQLSDGARYPAFDERYFAREREVVIGEMDRHDSDPYESLNKEMNDRVYFKYPSRKEPIGNRETVRNATTDMMRLIQGRYYVPNNSAVVVAGDVTPQQAFAAIEKFFGDWPRRPVDPFVEFPMVEHPPLPKSEGGILVKPVQNVVVKIEWQGPSIGKDDPATWAADLFSFILLQPDSHFQRTLVDSGLVSELSMGYYTQRNVGPISVLFMTTPQRARAAVRAVYDEIAHFNDPTYYTDEELESGKALLEADDLYSREKVSEYVHNIAFWWSSTGLDYFRGYLAHLRSSSRADIRRFVSTYMLGKPHVGLALLSQDSLKVSGLTEADLIGGNAQ